MRSEKKAHTQSKHVIGSGYILWILRKLLMLFLVSVPARKEFWRLCKYQFELGCESVLYLFLFHEGLTSD